MIDKQSDRSVYSVSRSGKIKLQLRFVDMSTSISITLDDEMLRFIDTRSSDRSCFINDLLLAEKRRVFLQKLALAYQEQENDPNFQEEIAMWDVTVGDGLDA